MKSTNVRELMNILSEKYFGNEPGYSSAKPERLTVQTSQKNKQSSLSILSPVTSCKTSPKFNRISSSYAKKNQNFNYFEETRNKLKKSGTNERKRLEIKDLNELQNSEKEGAYESSVLIKKGGRLTEALAKKYAQKDENACIKPSEQTETDKIMSPQAKIMTTNSRLLKQSETKSVSRKLFLNEARQELNNVESNSTISNSRSSYNLTKERTFSVNKTQKRQRQTDVLKEQLEFYQQKCSVLEKQNFEMNEKIKAYDELFAEQKILVQNLKNQIMQRQNQINAIIEDKLSNFKDNEEVFHKVQKQNQTLKTQLQEVRKILRQQEAMIIELYAKNKQKSQPNHEKQIDVKDRSTSDSGQIRMNSPPLRNQSRLTKPLYSSYLANEARQSIQETCFEDD